MTSVLTYTDTEFEQEQKRMHEKAAVLGLSPQEISIADILVSLPHDSRQRVLAVVERGPIPSLEDQQAMAEAQLEGWAPFIQAYRQQVMEAAWEEISEGNDVY